MKGCVLAGGMGTRLYPLTKVTNKHLLPIYDRPMIYYPIQTLVEAGIDEIIIVVGGEFAGHFLRLLRNGKDFGIRHLEYAYQDESATGISDALRYAEEFVDGESVAVILGDNCTDYNIRADVDSFTRGAKIFLKEVPDANRFGVPVFEGDKIVKILEKPKDPPNNYCVTGLYLYDHTVFNKIRQLIPSSRGEYEITDVNNLYIEEKKMSHAVLDGFWSDAGSPKSLYQTNKYWAEKHE